MTIIALVDAAADPRPYCLEKTACAARGPKHCRRCHFTHQGHLRAAESQSDPEVRARMSAARKAALADPEVRARMSAARKAAWADPEVRARMSAASKAALADPEVRARMARAPARRAVLAAGLPLWRKTVDRAAELFAAGECHEVVVDALVQEARDAEGGERFSERGAA